MVSLSESSCAATAPALGGWGACAPTRNATRRLRSRPIFFMVLGLTDPFRRDVAVFLGQIDVDELPAGFRGDGGDGAGAAERIEHDVAAIAVEFDQPIDQFFRKR